MMFDNAGIDYSRMLLFVFSFLIFGKIEPNSHAFSRLWLHRLQSGHVKVVKKIKCYVKDINFLGLITINNISTPFFSWKIPGILFVSVIDNY